jgi:hypothetical protein
MVHLPPPGLQRRSTSSVRWISTRSQIVVAVAGH